MPRPVHFEIHAADPERVKAFYEALFGWNIEQWGDNPYWLIKTGEGRGIDGGMVKRMGPAPDPLDPMPVIAWVCTVDVDNVDAYVAKAQALGGVVAVPKMPIPGVGWLAYVKDTDANILGLMTADPGAA
ncbi:MAG TPA: VOC family protein [Caulobacteraceae bacterium]|jgi:hypothetical protein